MKKNSTLFLELVIYCIGIAVLGALGFFTIALINHDGRELFIPILFIMYATAIPFFTALFQTVKLLGHINKNMAFSEASVRALKSIKYCAIAVSALYAAGLPLLMYVAEQDDAPGVVGFGLISIFASIVIATFSAVLQKLVQNGLDIQAENESTI